MKATKKVELQNLTVKELKQINGGSQLTYWISYGLGWWGALGIHSQPELVPFRH